MCNAKLPDLMVYTGKSSGVLECTNKFSLRQGVEKITLFTFLFDWHNGMF